MINSRFPIRSAALLLGLLMAATACSSSATPVATPAPANPTADSAAPDDADTSADATDVAPDEGSDATDAPADAPSSTEPAEAPPATTESRVVEVILDDGPPLLLPATFCAFNPDATGAAAAIVNISGEAESGAEVNLLEAWPFDGTTENGTSFIGTYVDEDDTLYVFEGAEVRGVGDMVEVTGPVHTNVFYAIGDEPAGTLTVRCQP